MADSATANVTSRMVVRSDVRLPSQLWKICQGSTPTKTLTNQSRSSPS